MPFQTGRQHLFPVKSKKAPVRERYFNYIVLQQEHPTQGLQLAMRERTAKDIWQNLFDFYLLETDEPIEKWQDLTLPEFLQKAPTVGKPIESASLLTQLLSHQRIQARFYRLVVPFNSLDPLPEDLNWFIMNAVENNPKPVLITNYLKTLFG